MEKNDIGKIQVFDKDIKQQELKYHNKRVAVSKEFTFDAAHHLYLYNGKCSNMHGHTYKLIITISGFSNSIGITLDFVKLNKIYRSIIEEKLDHKYLNNALPKMNTTAENMVVWIWEEIAPVFLEEEYKKQGIRLEELTLYETPTSYVRITRQWMECNE